MRCRGINLSPPSPRPPPPLHALLHLGIVYGINTHASRCLSSYPTQPNRLSFDDSLLLTYVPTLSTTEIMCFIHEGKAELETSVWRGSNPRFPPPLWCNSYHYTTGVHPLFLSPSNLNPETLDIGIPRTKPRATGVTAMFKGKCSMAELTYSWPR